MYRELETVAAEFGGMSFRTIEIDGGPTVDTLEKRERVDKPYFRYSKTSPGWHSNALQIASKVDSRTALALPFFKMEMLAIVMPTLSASSVTLIFRFANMTSMLIMIAMPVSLYR
jgi:hypothetical protein